MKTLIIGASSKPERYSFLALESLLKHNHEVLAIGKQQETINGIAVETEKKPFQGVHTVTMYLNPNNQKEYYSYVVGLKPQRVIFNPGTENPEFFEILKSYKIPYESACTLVLLSTGQF